MPVDRIKQGIAVSQGMRQMWAARRRCSMAWKQCPICKARPDGTPRYHRVGHRHIKEVADGGA